MDTVQTYKLGRMPSIPDPRTLKAAKYFAPDLMPPEEVHNDKFTDGKWNMFANDRYGCCTCASFGHAVDVWTAGGGKEKNVTVEDVLAMYRVIGHGQDNGAMAIDACRYMKNTGLAGHRIVAFAGIEPSDILTMKRTIWMFGCAYLGVNLCSAWQGRKEWLAPRDPGDIFVPRFYNWRPGSWGGHAIITPSYDAKGHHPVTWGSQVRVSWWVHQFPNLRQFPTYVEEAYCPFSEEWIDKASKKTRYGFDAVQLRKDIASIGQMLSAKPVTAAEPELL